MVQDYKNKTVMKTYIFTILTVVLATCCLFYLGFIFGEKTKQEEIEKRAQETDCIELIIFNESQL